MAILNKRISSATLPQLQKDARLGSIIRDVSSAPATQNEMFRTINPSASTNETPSPAYVSQLTSALRDMQGSPQNMTSRIAPTQSNNVSLMSSQMPDMSNAPNISKGPITSITSPGDSARQKIGSTTTTSGGVPSAIINALAGAVMGAGASKLINGKTTTTPATGNTKDKAPVTSTVSTLPKWAQGNPNITDNKDGTYTQKNPDDGSTSTMDKDGNIIGTTDSNGDIFDAKGRTIHDNGNGTHTIIDKDGTTTVVNDEGTVVVDSHKDDYTEYPIKGSVIEDPIVDVPINDGSDFSPVYEEPAGKRGGLAVMMKSGGVAHFKDGGVTQDNGNGTSTTTYPDKTTVTKDDQGNVIRQTDANGNIISGSDPIQSLLDLVGTTGGAAGAGGLLAALLSSTGGNTTTQNTGLDMSTYGQIGPHTTNFGMGPAKYVPYKDYSQKGNYTPNAELLHNLNAPASNPVNEGDYKDPYATNRPGTTNNQGTDMNALIAQIVNAIKNKQLTQNVAQASGTPNAGTSTPNASVGGSNIPAASTPSGGGFTVGGGNAGGEYGAFGGKEGYDKAVALQTAKTNAENAARDAYQIPPDSPFYAASKGATGDNLNNLKEQAYEFQQRQENRAKLAAANPGEEITSSGPNNEGYSYGASKFGVTSKDYLPNVKTQTSAGDEFPEPVKFGGIQDEPTTTPSPVKFGGIQDEPAAPLSGGMATGGLTHYTFGKPADVMENLGLRQQQMARGGLPHVSNVPVVQGRMDFRQGSAVHGEGDGQSDDIPAMLADGEYVIDAETVAQIGNGSTKAGAQALDKFRESIRAHKRSAPINKIPPKTKALTSYLKVK